MSGRRHVFGPVMSGRLGRSLGIDPLGAAICSLDCLYCEAGPTRALTVDRKTYAAADKVLAELADWRDEGHPAPDVVTLGGSGEPTLSRECGQIIAGAKSMFPGVPVAVLTNSTLFGDSEVRAGLLDADMVLPSMDTLVEKEFRRINRPHQSLDLDSIRRGVLAFRSEYRGLIFLEILLLAGINDTGANLAALRGFCAELHPDRIDVTTMSRPGAYPEARPADEATLLRFRRELGAEPPPPPVGVEAGPGAGDSAALAQSVWDSLVRRPQTAEGLAAALAAPASAVEAALNGLERAGRIRRHEMGGRFHFLPASR